jgi:uncharacterized lipoprotein
MRLVFAAVAVVSAMLTGCATHPVPVNYSPSSVLSASGSLKVTDFAYLPAEAPATPTKAAIASNQIRNTAIGDILIDRDVKVFVRDAVFAELRFVGVKTNVGRCELKGTIEDFLIDDLGYSIDWLLRVKYELIESATKKPAYATVKNVTRKTAKGLNPFGALNEIVKLNVEELIKDPEFIKAIQ